MAHTPTPGTALVTRRSLRVLGWAAIAYSGVGAVLLALAAVIAGGAVTDAGGLTRAVGRSLLAATATVDSSAAAFEGFDASLDRAGRATGEATILVRDASTTMERLATSLGIIIFGTQPLSPLQADAAASAEQLAAVGDELQELTGALTANRGDVAAIRTDLEQLAVRLDELRERIEPLAGDGVRPGIVQPLLLAMLAWTVLPTVGSLLLGVYLLRLSRRVPA